MVSLTAAIPVFNPGDHEIEQIGELNALLFIGDTAVIAPPMDQQQKAGLLSHALRGFRHIAVDRRVAMLVTDVILRRKRDRLDALLDSHRSS